VSSRSKGLARAAVTLAFFAVVVWLLRNQLRGVDPHEILAAVRRLSALPLGAALVLTAGAYAVVACYDRLSARYAGVRLGSAVGFSIPFVSYAFNFNIGALVGALAFRYRLYSREGVDARRIAAIAACSIATNWCGCLTVLGAMLLADPSPLAEVWGLSPAVGRALGGLAWAPVAAYAIAARVRRQPLRIRGSAYRLPELRLVLAQIGLGSAYWLLVPLVLFALRPPEASIGYPQLALAFGLAAIGGIIVRVPAGLGVIEAVYLELFRARFGAAPILAMLFAWRAIFLLAPLGVAAVVLLALESRGRAREARPRVRRRRSIST
jgi:glycosyltransferase 2 family protein